MALETIMPEQLVAETLAKAEMLAMEIVGVNANLIRSKKQ